jgi:ribonuclease R
VARKVKKAKARKRDEAAAEKLDQRRLLTLFGAGRKPLTPAHILRALNLKRTHRGELIAVLDELVAKGRLVRVRSAYGAPEHRETVTGRLQVQRSGVGFVIPDTAPQKQGRQGGRKGDPLPKADIFVAEKDLGDAWHGDRVAVAVVRQRRGKNREGRVVRVLERGRTALSVTVVRAEGPGVSLCRPTEPRMYFAVRASHDAESLQPGTLCLVAPGEKLDHNLWEGRVTAVLGAERDVAAQEAVTKTNHAIPVLFPEAALREAQALPETPAGEDTAARRDLRGLGLVTIDGADARDFDDAVHVERHGKGWVLTVAIADVSHYVAPGSALDREALERGNSYYFPRSVEPMFPERLSNGLCSLNPGVDRLAMAARIEFSAQGLPGKAEFFPAVINSKARLTYTQVEAAVIAREPKAREGINHVIDMLDEAERLARKLTAQREKRGSIDFELPEPEVQIDGNGRVVSVKPRKHLYAYRIIEEFMVAANEAVARFLTENGPACLYRIHPEADEEKLVNLYRVLARTGRPVETPSEVTPRALQRLVAQVAGTELEFLVSRLLLRSMKQARYSPEYEGHFGLASEAYCHFTSPIRRYADLAIHRLLKYALGDQSLPVPGPGKLRDIADRLYATERKAMEAEREMDRRVAALHLLDHVGEEYDGVVSFLAEFGFSVELTDVLAEGMVRLATLRDDYYTYWKERELLVGERTGKALRLGDRVRVRVASVNLAALEIELALVSGGADYKTYLK